MVGKHCLVLMCNTCIKSDSTLLPVLGPLYHDWPFPWQQLTALAGDPLLYALEQVDSPASVQKQILINC